MLTTSDLARVICCEGGACIKPEACDAHREYRVTVSPAKAAAAVHRLLCAEWRKYRNTGPMTVIREAGRDE